jgi:hypothetical protein
MTRLLTALILAIAAGLWPPGAAMAAAPKPAEAAAPVDCADDGHAGAPAGTPMYAARRATWAHPPPCQVPDVDYPVGPDARVKLVSPAAPGALPAGAGYDPKNHRVRCDGANGLTLQNLDFGLVGGGGFYFYDCNNVTLRNIKITWNCLSRPIQQAASSRNIIIDRVWIDGGGTSGAANCPSNSGEIVVLQGSGEKKITYTRVINSDQHGISFNCTGSCTVVDRYNSFSRFGFAQGDHDNATQWGGSFTSSDISYNYYYNPQPDTPLIAPLPAVFKGNQAVVTIPGANQSSFLPGQSVTSANLAPGTLIVASEDAGGVPDVTTLLLSKKAISNGAGKLQVLNAYPIGDLNSIRYVAETVTTLANGTVVGNVFDGDGPIKGRTNAIACASDRAPALNTGLSIMNNYLNPAGTLGGLVTRNQSCAVAGSGNRRLDTGGMIPIR